MSASNVVYFADMFLAMTLIGFLLTLEFEKDLGRIRRYSFGLWAPFVLPILFGYVAGTVVGLTNWVGLGFVETAFAASVGSLLGVSIRATWWIATNRIWNQERE